ncbi:MAG TPA: hypothetical protein VF589_04105 [Allosphingosinicella sp.]|jgi:hypothetical protein
MEGVKAMGNLSTIGGATIWVAVVFALMLAVIEPVSVTSSTGQPASGAAQGETKAPASQ